MTGSLQLIRTNSLENGISIRTDDLPLPLHLGDTFADTDTGDDSLVQYLLAYANQAKQEIANQAARIRFLETLSQTDELTGILNRRGFLSALDQALSAAARYGERGLVAFIDLDEFKQINDVFGHGMGDRVLCKVAEILKSNIRATDAAGRLGGDEFAVLLTRSGDLAARTHLESIRQKINATRFKSDLSEVRVSATFGIQSYGPNSTANDLLTKADQDMYNRKQKRADR